MRASIYIKSNELEEIQLKHEDLKAEYDILVNDLEYVIEEYNKGNNFTPPSFYNIPVLPLSSRFFLIKEFNLTPLISLNSFMVNNDDINVLMEKILVLLNKKITGVEMIADSIYKKWEECFLDKNIVPNYFYHDGFYSVVDSLPMVCDKTLRDYINQQINIHPSNKYAKEKEMITCFIEINMNGEVGEVLIDKKTGTEKDSLLINIIENLPKMKPAISKGKPVNFRYYSGFDM